MRFYKKLTACLGIALMASGCSTIQEQSDELMKFEQSKEGYEIANIYPESTNAPQAPTDTRPDAAWDSAAQDLINLRDNFDAPSASNPEKTPEQIRREFEALKAKVDAYKLDDPQ